MIRAGDRGRLTIPKTIVSWAYSVLFRIRSIATFNTVDQQLFARVMQAVLGGTYKTYICHTYHWHIYCKLCPKPIFGCLRFCVTTQILLCARNFIAFGILSRNVHNIECFKNCGSSLRKRLSTHAAQKDWSAFATTSCIRPPLCTFAQGWRLESLTFPASRRKPQPEQQPCNQPKNCGRERRGLDNS